jgi:drug/metabolite transporter (DMT)-like permease
MSMNQPAVHSPHTKTRTWTIVLALALVYLSWGTTYFVIRVGVHTHRLPPALFGGTRVGLAGTLLLGYLWLRRERLRLQASELLGTTIISIILFVGGNGLMTFAVDRIPSGVAALLAATTPLWMAMMQACWPKKDRLSPYGWLGLLAGLGGVALLATGTIQGTDSESGWGAVLALSSAVSWAFGSLLMRNRRRTVSHLTTAAYQMALGGWSLALLGLAMGETRRVTPDQFTPAAVFVFCYLLVVGSLVGFVAFNWLLGHVSALLVGTYAYVNPLVAIVIGFFLGGEPLTARILAGMATILAGVALVRKGTTLHSADTANQANESR